MEGGAKVPGFVHSPLLPTSGETDALFHATDWYPTFMRLAGESKEVVKNMKFDGVDQFSTLFNGQDKHSRYSFCLLGAFHT